MNLKKKTNRKQKKKNKRKRCQNVIIQNISHLNRKLIHTQFEMLMEIPKKNCLFFPIVFFVQSNKVRNVSDWWPFLLKIVISSIIKIYDQIMISIVPHWSLFKRTAH